eukprot:gene2190-2899_t
MGLPVGVARTAMGQPSYLESSRKLLIKNAVDKLSSNKKQSKPRKDNMRELRRQYAHLTTERQKGRYKEFWASGKMYDSLRLHALICELWSFEIKQ